MGRSLQFEAGIPSSMLSACLLIASFRSRVASVPEFRTPIAEIMASIRSKIALMIKPMA
jgi:hypothetical protein